MHNCILFSVALSFMHSFKIIFHFLNIFESKIVPNSPSLISSAAQVLFLNPKILVLYNLCVEFWTIGNTNGITFYQICEMGTNLSFLLFFRQIEQLEMVPILFQVLEEHHNSPTGSVVRHVLGIVNCMASYEGTHMQGLYGHGKSQFPHWQCCTSCTWYSKLYG